MRVGTRASRGFQKPPTTVRNRAPLPVVVVLRSWCGTVTLCRGTCASAPCPFLMGAVGGDGASARRLFCVRKWLEHAPPPPSRRFWHRRGGIGVARAGSLFPPPLLDRPCRFFHPSFLASRTNWCPPRVGVLLPRGLEGRYARAWHFLCPPPCPPPLLVPLRRTPIPPGWCRLGCAVVCGPARPGGDALGIDVTAYVSPACSAIVSGRACSVAP
jgi:hypothetical protein